MTNQTIPVLLECGHQRWFYKAHYPEPGGDIWCVTCNRYTKAEATPRVASIEGDWRWTPITKGRYLVECNRTLPNGEMCTHHFTTGRGWHWAESQMDKHLKSPPHGSGRFTSNIVIERVNHETPPF